MAAQPNLPPSTSSTDDYSLINARETADTLLEQCVALICQQCGFDTITRSALELLKQLVSVYWKEFLQQVARDAELAGRPRPNLNDIRYSLEKYGLIQSVTSDMVPAISANEHDILNAEASLVTNIMPTNTHYKRRSRVTNSTESATATTTKTTEVTSHVVTIEALKQELINHRDIHPWNELLIRQKRTPSTRGATSTNLQSIAGILGTLDSSTAEEGKPTYILSHMPPLPPKYTFKHTLMVTQKLRDYSTLRMESADQSRMVEESLKKLMATANTNSSTNADVQSSNLKRSLVDTNNNTAKETMEEAWSHWPLVNCEFTSDRVNLMDADDITPLTSTLVSSSKNHWSTMSNPLSIPATTVLAWPTGIATTTTTTTSSYHSAISSTMATTTTGTMDSNGSLFRANHSKLVVNPHRLSSNTKPN